MTSENGNLFFAAGIDVSALRRDADSCKDLLHGIGETARSEGESIEVLAMKMRNALGMLGVATGLKEFTGQVFSTRAEIESLSISFETLLGSSDKAEKLFSEIREFAVSTPMMLKDLASGAQTMLGFNIADDEVMTYLKAIGDISMGDAEKFNSLTLAFSQMSAAGKLMGEDLMQMIGQGFNPLTVIAEKSGKKLAEVKAEMAAGRITVQQVQQAFIDATSEGGKYYGMLEKQSHGLAGAYSNLRGAVDDALNSIGESTQGLMMTTIDAATTIAQNWDLVALAIGAVATGWGLQKAVDMTSVALSHHAAAAAYQAEAAALASLLPEKMADTTANAAQIASTAGLTEAQSAHITAMRAEAKEYVKSLQLKADEAVAAQIAAAAKVTSARQELAAMEELLAAELAELEACNMRADAAGMAAAERNVAVATEMRDTAATAANTAATELQIATQNVHTTSTAANTAAMQLDTAATAGDTAATGLLTIAKERCKEACIRLWGVIAANPVMAVVVAVTALAYGIYKLITYQTEAEKSQAALNTAMGEAEAKAGQETAALDKLWDELQNAKKGTQEWHDAKAALVSQFGQYYANLDSELEKVQDLSLVYAQLTKEIKRSEAAKAISSVREEFAPDNGEFLADMRKNLSKSVKDKDTLNRMMAEISDYIYAPASDKPFSGTGPLSDDTYRLLKNQKGFFDAYSGFTKLSMQRSKQTTLQSQLDDAARNFGFEDASDVLNGGKGEKSGSDTKERGGKEIDDEIKQKKEELAKHKTGTAEWKKIDAEITKLTAERRQYGDYDRDHKKSTGPNAAQLAFKEENAEGKLADVLRKQAQERLQLEKDYEMERWQTRVDLMEEGSAKVIAQQELDNAKELEALKRRQAAEEEQGLQRQIAEFDAREAVKAAADKSYGKKVFRDEDIDESKFNAISARYKELYADLEARQRKAEADRLKASKEAMNAYLKEYGSYQQKRQALTEEYEDRIDRAQTEGERMSLIAERNKSLSDLEYDEWIDSGSIALAFGDVSKLSASTIDQLIADMERYREKVVATFDPDKIKKYEDALAGLRAAKGSGGFSGLSSIMPDYFREKRDVAERMDSSAASINALYERRAELYNRVLDLRRKISDAEAKGEDSSELKKQLDETQVALDANASAAVKAQNTFRNLSEIWDKLESPEDKFMAICAAVEAAAQVVGQLASQASEMADALGAEGLGEALGYLGDAMGSLQNIASGFAQGGIFGGIVAAAGEAMNWITKLAMAGDAKHQKNIENLQKQIDALQKSYDKLGKSASEAFSTDASAMIEQQNQLLLQQKALIRQQMMEEEAKKKTDDDKMQEYRDTLDEIDEAIADNKKSAKEAIIGDDIKTAISDFASALTDAWAQGKNAAEATKETVKNLITSAMVENLKKNIQPAATAFYDELANAMADGVITDEELAKLDALKSEIDRVGAADEEQYKKIQDRYKSLEELQEELTDISFDSVSDNFKSLLTDMESSAADFTDSFSEMLRNALVEGLMNSKYDAMLKEWYAEFAEAMDDQRLSDDERDALRQKYDAIVNQGLADRDAINEIVGGGAYSQSASAGGWAAMGQDTAEELNGRFTALTELSAIANQYLAEGNAIAARVLATLESYRLGGDSAVSGADSQTLLSIKDMMFLSTGYLEDIAKSARYLSTIYGGIEELRNLIDRRL